MKHHDKCFWIISIFNEIVRDKSGVLLKRQVSDLLNTPALIQLLSNQQREPGKKSRPGGAAESEQPPPACIAFTFYPGGGLSSRYG
jgi:hypothetical protein